MGLITIQLQDIRFFSHHGLYAEEAQTGATFEASIAITYAINGSPVHEIDQTIDYVSVYEVAQNHLSERKELLETTVMQIGAHLKKKYPQIQSVRVKLKKLHPPITHFTGAVSVTYEETY